MEKYIYNKFGAVSFAIFFALSIAFAIPVFADEPGFATFDYAPAGTATFDYAPSGGATFDYAPSGNAKTYNVNDINSYLPVGENNGYGILGGPGTATFDYAPSAPGTATFDYAPTPGTATFDYAPSQPGTATFDYAPKEEPGTATFDYAPKLGEVTFDYAPDYRTVDIYGVTPEYAFLGYPGFRGGYGPSFGLGFGISPSFASPVVFSSPAIIQPAFVSSAPSVSSASASATAVASVTNINTVSAPPQYQAQYIAPTYVTPTYYNPPQYTAQYIPPPPPPPPAPYVALTQIPYTGIDGSVAYWLTLIGIVAAAAYSLVYFMPHLFTGKSGISALAFAGLRRKQNAIAAPARLIEASIPEKRTGTNDSMVTVHSKDGPRIVINRD